MSVMRPTAFFKFWHGFRLLQLLHTSLFLFLAGLLIYLINISRTTFGLVTWCVLGFTFEYTVASVSTILLSTQLQLSTTPVSPSACFMHIYFIYVTSQFHYVGSLVVEGLQNQMSGLQNWMRGLQNLFGVARMRYHDIWIRYTEALNTARAKSLEKEAFTPSPEIDTEVLERMLLVLDNDHALEGFFDTIPGFCDSKLVQKPLHPRVTTKLRRSLDGFLDRTFSSNLVPESVRSYRLITCLNAAHSALGPSGVSQVLGNFFTGHRDEALKSVEIGHSLVRWGHRSEDLIGVNVRRIVACIITHAQDRDDRWAELVKEAFDISDGAIRDYVAHGDSMLLAILNHVTREALRIGRSEQGVLESLSQFDIHNTTAELQHDFCTLWNEVIQAAINEGTSGPPTRILFRIRRPFADLHQGTNATPIRFPAPIGDDDNVLSWPWSYRSCNIASHHPDSAANSPVTSSPTIPPPTQLSDSPNASLHPTLPSRLPVTTSRDLATENATADISVASGIADPIRSSSSGGSSALQQADEAGTMPHLFVSGSLPAPIPTPALCGTTDSAVLPPSIDSTPMQTDHVRHSLGASSSTSTTIPLSVAPQVAMVSDQFPDARDGTTGAQYDNQDTHPVILGEDHRQPPPGGATGL